MQHTLKNIGTAFILSAILWSGCTEQSRELPKEEKFELTDTLIGRLKIDTVQGANNQTELNFSARITANEEKIARIYPMVSGYVQRVPVKLGDRVGKGQVLAVMTSAEMAGFDKEAISSSAELKNAQRSAKLAEDMYNSGLASARELEQANNELMVKLAEDKRNRTLLNLNGGNKNGIYTLKSPISGFIIEKNLTDNMQVRPDNSENLFTVADLSDVWAMLNIYESDIARVKEGDEVSITVLSYPDEVFKGKISKVYSMLNNESKVMNARVVIPNTAQLLKPGMMGRVQIAGRNNNSLPVVNADCLIFDNNRYFALVLDPVKKVRIQEVELSRKFENKAYISNGLRAGDRVIASKQLFLYDSLKP
ncbi:efflux RND transporter periplasmic adaptor subunit [Pedobacter africanus]|uniref:Membrane fusion protein, cobalt-zinc-cadmium efflux system n=1 Tax=Pedobacter africanus TaxID=151894 RepID=A0A1W2DXY1_9SPHI|nr:efflux RND transporter periplasmic adaptor subunit [Pedobacter africanus]SMD01906.1 membrane fusion protein, cobalt-zinc-cadmium efflux system [Pedobacter africanus]